MANKEECSKCNDLISVAKKSFWELPDREKRMLELAILKSIGWEYGCMGVAVCVPMINIIRLMNQDEGKI